MDDRDRARYDCHARWEAMRKEILANRRAEQRRMLWAALACVVGAVGFAVAVGVALR